MAGKITGSRVSNDLPGVLAVAVDSYRYRRDIEIDQVELFTPMRIMAYVARSSFPPRMFVMQILIAIAEEGIRCRSIVHIGYIAMTLETHFTAIWLYIIGDRRVIVSSNKNVKAG